MVSFEGSAYVPRSGREKRGGHESGDEQSCSEGSEYMPRPKEEGSYRAVVGRDRGRVEQRALTMPIASPLFSAPPLQSCSVTPGEGWL